MPAFSSSTCSLEKECFLSEKFTGAYKVKYHPHEDWDFDLDTAQQPVDVSLVLPHYRARNQPVDHRMSMFVGAESGSVKLKVCRNAPRSKFYLEVQALSSDVTIWLPSDFNGHIRHSRKASFSAGFVNRIMRHVGFNEADAPNDAWDADEVVVNTRGAILFRMWDVNTGAPERPHKETLKRIFGCANKAPETAIDWDFLLED